MFALFQEVLRPTGFGGERVNLSNLFPLEALIAARGSAERRAESDDALPRAGKGIEKIASQMVGLRHDDIEGLGHHGDAEAFAVYHLAVDADVEGPGVREADLLGAFVFDQPLVVPRLLQRAGLVEAKEGDKAEEQHGA